jgi:hypothetical protein
MSMVVGFESRHLELQDRAAVIAVTRIGRWVANPAHGAPEHRALTPRSGRSPGPGPDDSPIAVREIRGPRTIDRQFIARDGSRSVLHEDPEIRTDRVARCAPIPITLEMPMPSPDCPASPEANDVASEGLDPVMAPRPDVDPAAVLRFARELGRLLGDHLARAGFPADESTDPTTRPSHPRHQRDPCQGG